MIKKIYGIFCKVEETAAYILLMMIAVLVFVSAIARTLNHPLNWAGDIALLAFGWQVFLGGDIAVRNTKLVGIDMLINRFPKVLQKWLSIVFSFMILGFLCVLTYFGYILVSQTMLRLMNTLTISYAWCTLAVPVGTTLMIISSIIKLIASIKTPVAQWSQT